MEKIVILMPAWNEAENIKEMIRKLFDVEFPKIKAEMHLLIVDNASTDGMTKIVKKEAEKRDKLHLIQQGKKKGLGNAYVAGFKYAMEKLGADAVMEMDADGQHPPEFVKPMVTAYLGGAQYVIGSRYIPGGSVPREWAISRKAISYFGNLFIRLVLLKPKLHDLTTGFRLMKVKGVLSKIDLDNLMELERFAYKVDLLYQCVKNSKKTVEVPLEFKPRLKDKSKFNTKEMIATFKVAIILGIKDKQRFISKACKPCGRILDIILSARFIKFGTVGFIGYVINAIGLEVFARLDFPEWAVWAVATEIAIISNFTLNNIWTYKTEKITGLKKLGYKFFQFNLTSAGALIIQTVFGTLGVSAFGPQYRQLLLPVIILFLVVPYNYFMYNVVIWKTWKPPWKKNKK